MKNKTSLTADLRFGDLTQALRLLKSKGVVPDDIAALNSNTALLDDIAATFLKHRLFSTPEEQIRRMLHINTNMWHNPNITRDTIQALGRPSECPTSDENGLYCVTLLYETGNTVETLRQNWEAFVYIHGAEGVWKSDSLMFDNDHMRLREGAKQRPKGLRWAIVELGRAFRDRHVESVRSTIEVMGMGQELLLVAAMHPHWAKAMDGNEIPFIDVPDLEVRPREQTSFDHALYLTFDPDGSRVELMCEDCTTDVNSYGCGSFLA
jgi:hypothetical protein